MNIASSKLGIALMAVFATCLVALIVELVYVLWRKRRFRHRSAVSGGGDSVDSELSSSPFYAAHSKELLYFFCWKNQPTRVEPSSTPAQPSAPADSEPAAAVDDADDEEELAKWQSRLLYTIKEEESVGSSADQSEAKSERRVCLRDCFSAAPVEMADDVAVDIVEEEATPFSTPCASPPYFTPSPSPVRDVGVLIFSPSPVGGSDDETMHESDVSVDKI